MRKRLLGLLICFMFATPLLAQRGKNKHPNLTVNAGPDQTVTYPATVDLYGTYTLSPSGSVTVSWTKSSGPGVVTFTNTHIVNPTATFSLAGTYVLKFTVSASRVSKSDTLTVLELTAPLDPVNLSWTASVTSGVSGYNVYRSTISGVFSGAPLNGGTLVTTTTYTDSTVQSNNTYYYIVRAVATSLESAASNQVSAVR